MNLAECKYIEKRFKDYFNQMVNGLTHARYVFVGTKRCRA